MQFNELNIMPAILRALKEEEYEVPTPIQEEAIPVILNGKDLLGCAQTGTGKTAAFAIPTLQLLSEEKIAKNEARKIRALIITPTRELALQIYESFCTYGKYTSLRCCVVFGGVSQKPQEEQLQQGVDILIATPGRLLDLMNQAFVDIKHIKIFILDEADRMLDMGFIHDVNRIIAKTPSKKQTLLFSATIPPSIEEMSRKILVNPLKIAVTPVSSTVDTIQQFLYYVDKENKKDLLLHLLKDRSITSVLVFTRTKHGADRVVKQLEKANISAKAIHGDKSQGARQQALSRFKEKSLRVLVATDIAARGIDIDELSHVINYDLPEIPETYVHRIGRTGRAGLNGIAISFCDFDEKELLADIEKLIKKPLTEVENHPYPLLKNYPAEKTTQPRRAPKQKDPASSATIQKERSDRSTAQRGSAHKATAQKEQSNKSTSQKGASPKTTTQKEQSAKGSTQRSSEQRITTQKEWASNTSTQRGTAPNHSQRTPKSYDSNRKPYHQGNQQKSFKANTTTEQRSKIQTPKEDTFRSRPYENNKLNSETTETRTATPAAVEAQKKERLSLGGTLKKKLRMTMDGTLKEQKSQSRASGQGKNKFWHSKKN